MKLDYKTYCSKVRGCYLGKNIGYGSVGVRSSALFIGYVLHIAYICNNFAVRQIGDSVSVALFIGGTLGAPFECFRGVYDIDFFMQDVSSPVPNDDVDLQLVWLSAIEHEGKNLDSHMWSTQAS